VTQSGGRDRCDGADTDEERGEESAAEAEPAVERELFDGDEPDLNEEQCEPERHHQAVQVHETGEGRRSEEALEPEFVLDFVH